MRAGLPIDQHVRQQRARRDADAGRLRRLRVRLHARWVGQGHADRRDRSARVRAAVHVQQLRVPPVGDRGARDGAGAQHDPRARESQPPDHEHHGSAGARDHLRVRQPRQRHQRHTTGGHGRCGDDHIDVRTGVSAGSVGDRSAQSHHDLHVRLPGPSHDDLRSAEPSDDVHVQPVGAAADDDERSERAGSPT
jgi:hypothetical protein